MSTSYPSNLSDAEWVYLQRYLPPQSKHGRPPIHSLRSIFDAIFYVLRTGCPWRYLPANFPRLSNGVLPFSALAPQRDLDAAVAGIPSGRTRTARKEPAPERRYHGCAKRQNR